MLMIHFGIRKRPNDRLQIHEGNQSVESCIHRLERGRVTLFRTPQRLPVETRSEREHTPINAEGGVIHSFLLIDIQNRCALAL